MGKIEKGTGKRIEEVGGRKREGEKGEEGGEGEKRNFVVGRGGVEKTHD